MKLFVTVREKNDAAPPIAFNLPLDFIVLVSELYAPKRSSSSFISLVMMLFIFIFVFFCILYNNRCFLVYDPAAS